MLAVLTKYQQIFPLGFPCLCTILQQKQMTHAATIPTPRTNNFTSDPHSLTKSTTRTPCSAVVQSRPHERSSSAANPGGCGRRNERLYRQNITRYVAIRGPNGLQPGPTVTTGCVRAATTHEDGKQRPHRHESSRRGVR